MDNTSDDLMPFSAVVPSTSSFALVSFEYLAESCLTSDEASFSPSFASLKKKGQIIHTFDLLVDWAKSHQGRLHKRENSGVDSNYE